MDDLGPRTFAARPSRRAVDSVVDLVAIPRGAADSRRAFPTAHTDGLNPILVLDRWGPRTLEPEETAVFGPEPRCLVEVLTWVRSGAIKERVSLGPLVEAEAGPGDWLYTVCGSGVIHEHTARGQVDAVQLWIDMPKRQQGAEPELQHVPTAAIPAVALDEEGSRVRVVAGTYGDAVGPISLAADVHLLHVFLEPGAVLSHRVPGWAQVGALVVDGFARVGHGAAGRPAKAGEWVVWNHDGTEVQLRATETAGAELLLVLGRPLRQPVVRFGPFIGRSEGDIRKAMFAFQRGRYGKLG